MASEKKSEWQYSNAPTIYSDIVNIATRNSDDIVLLQFMSYLPDKIMENFRTMMTKEDVIEFMDSAAQILDYYPVKKTTKNKKTVSETK